MSSTSLTSTPTLKDVVPVRKIASSRNQIFLARSTTHEQDYALKLFPITGDKASNSYQNESRFVFFNHENIIKFYSVKSKQKSTFEGNEFYASFILMELAPFGDLHSIVSRQI
mmetsp:Transcript_15932/g.13498  ORF Transcript_15932/g.13498 Transcript_15932/m.13498 type:complete len:113 (+) Transcript_15932:95-433(+)